jgi:SWI/SNF-related matrix-associated actin-dependent regulator 1 of chromatin subfamily A
VLDALNKQKKDVEVAKDTMMFAEDREAVREASFVKHALFFEQFRNTGRAKLPAVCDYLLEAVGEEDVGPKFLVFAHHIDVLDGICHALNQKKVKFIRIDGRTPAVDRQPLVEVFQSTPTVRVAVLSITAAGVGLTLTAASNVFFAELFYNPGSLLQAEDRAHRIGQLNSVNVHYLVARHTIDETLFRMLNSKIGVLGETLDGISGKKLEIMSGQDREAETSVLKNFSEDAFLAEVVNMTKGAAPEPERKRARFLSDDEDENEPEVDADAILKAVREQPPFSKFAAFSFGGAKK